MHESNAAICCAIQVAPVGHTCHSRAGCPQDAQQQREIRSTGNTLIFVIEPGKVKHHRTAPGPKRYIGQRGMHRVSKPRSIEHILDFAIRLPWLTKELQKPTLKWRRQLIKPRLTLNDLRYGITERRNPKRRALPNFSFPPCSICSCSFISFPQTKQKPFS